MKLMQGAAAPARSVDTAWQSAQSRHGERQTMACDPKRLREIMADAAPPELELAFRPMFGGIMAYAEGKAFASLSNVGMAIKAKGPLFAEFTAVEGAAPL